MNTPHITLTYSFIATNVNVLFIADQVKDLGSVCIRLANLIASQSRNRIAWSVPPTSIYL